MFVRERSRCVIETRFCILLLLLALTACARQQPPTSILAPRGQPAEIVIGSYMPVTSPFATYGDSSVKGMRMAVEEINGKGGVLGKKIRLVVEDDEGKPDCVEKLTEQKDIPVIIGEVASKCSLAASDICQRKGIPMVSTASTSPKVTEKGDYIFRVCFTDDFQGLACARLAHDLGFDRAAVFVDQTNDYSIGLADRFSQAFQEFGGRVVDRENFSEGDKDFNAQLSKMKTFDPDVIFVPSYYQEAGLIATQARQQGMRQTLIGGDGWDSPRLIEIAGNAVEDCLFLTHSCNTAEEPVMQEFVKAYQAKYAVEPDALAALGYDALCIVVDAIRRAGVAEPKPIRDALAQTKDFPGATGTITIDEQRNAKKAAYALVIKDGKAIYFKKIEPEEAAQTPAAGSKGAGGGQ